MGNKDAQALQLLSRRKRLKLGRSRVHAWGLFAIEPIEKDDFVIEYIGELISVAQSDKREKEYERSGLGSTYMFRVSDTPEDKVIDATMRGGKARFINHSCDPNCVARPIKVEGKPRIVIYSKRAIAAGEELCYDYKFSFEEDDAKQECRCGTALCRKWMN